MNGAPTPWSTGLLVSGFTAALSAVAAFAFGGALMEIHPILAIVLNAIAVGGAAPTVSRWRTRPVIRWVVYGAGLGVGLGWLALIAVSV